MRKHLAVVAALALAIGKFEDVGGKFDGGPAQATLYILDGNWQLFEIRPLE